MLQGSGILLFSPFAHVIHQLSAFVIIYMDGVLLGANSQLRPSTQPGGRTGTTPLHLLPSLLPFSALWVSGAVMRYAVCADTALHTYAAAWFDGICAFR